LGTGSSLCALTRLECSAALGDLEAAGAVARELDVWLRRRSPGIDVDGIHAFALLAELLDPSPIWSVVLERSRPPTDPYWITRIEPLLQCVPASPRLDCFRTWLHSA
jgi:hypothetical protein